MQMNAVRHSRGIANRYWALGEQRGRVDKLLWVSSFEAF